MVRVLVTGANGFVGRALCATLGHGDFVLRAAVRNGGGLSVPLPKGKIVSVGDIGPETDWDPALDGVDAIVHLAGRAHVLRETFKDPQAEFHRVNALGTERLALAAADAGVGRLVYISSAGVHGKATPGFAFTEDHDPAPHNPYTSSKLEAERALRRVAEETGLEATILRPPLIYGPGEKANFRRLLELVNSGLPLPLGSVNNRRSLLYVGNLADAVARCVERPEAAGQIFLIGDAGDVSTPELFRRVAQALGRPARIVPFPPAVLRATGRMAGLSSSIEPLLDSLVIDSSKIRRVLGWRGSSSMTEGLEETARWFKAAHPSP